MKVKKKSSEAKPEEKVITEKEKAKYEALKEMNAGGFLSETGKKELDRLEAVVKAAEREAYRQGYRYEGNQS